MSKSSKNLRQAYADFQHGLISLPLNVPGTAYRKCLQGRKKAVGIIKSILEERRATPETRKEKDFLDLVMEEMKKKGSLMTEEIALELLFRLVFAAFETTSAALLLKMLSRKKVLKDVEIKGYTIPAGWIVMVCPPAVHMDPKENDDPFVFNPWRRYHQNSSCYVSKWLPHSNI